MLQVFSILCGQPNTIDHEPENEARFPDAVRNVLTQLRRGDTQLSLWFASNQILDTHVQALLAAYHVNPVLGEVNLLNGIGDNGARILADEIAVNMRLQILGLQGNRISYDGAASLASALDTNSTLRVLSLRDNQVGGRGVVALADALKINTDLRSLDLGMNEVEDSGTMELATTLEVNSTLQGLDLSFNTVGTHGANALIDSLSVNTLLVRLDIEGNTIRTEVVTRITEMSTIESQQEAFTSVLVRRPDLPWLDNSLLQVALGIV